MKKDQYLARLKQRTAKPGEVYAFYVKITIMKSVGSLLTKPPGRHTKNIVTAAILCPYMAE